MINHIFLDLDGVLADFHEVFEQYTREEWLGGQFEQFVKNRGFLKLKRMRDAQALMSYLDTLNVPVTILSSAGGVEHLYEEICSQKFDWLKENHINYAAIIVENKEMKASFARKSTLLIDDQSINTENFIKAGGLAIRHTLAENTIERIKEILW